MKAVQSGKKLSRALIGVAILGMSVSTAANAEAIAFASNQLIDFSIVLSPGSSVTPIGVPQRTTQNSATYGPNGSPGTGVSSQDPQPLGNASDAPQAAAGPMPFVGQNVFTRVTESMMPGMIGARGDSQTAAGNPFDAGGVPFVRNVAEARVPAGLGFAGAGAGTNTANASFLYSFTLGEAGTIGFEFTNLYRYMASTSASGEAAQATISNSFTLADASGFTVYNFSPASINTGCASNSGVPVLCDSSLIEETFSGFSGPLAAGNYTVSLLTSSAVSVTSQETTDVPEPGTVALLGLGFLSLGLLRNRRRM